MITWYQPAGAIYFFVLLGLVTRIPVLYGIREGMFYISLAMPVDDEEEW